MLATNWVIGGWQLDNLAQKNMCSGAVDFTAVTSKQMEMNAGTFVSMCDISKLPPWQQKW